MARTNIVLDDRLVKEAMKLSGAKTKREVVDLALRQLVARRSVYRALRRLRGTLAWEGDVDVWRRSRR
jgi:Arc/MetJ family transcription regulator